MKGKKDMTEKRIFKRALGCVLAIASLYMFALIAAHYAATARAWAHGHGVSIDRLGQLGESFGPLTTVFAAVAAVGAWLSYRTQREQLDTEKRRQRRERFDALFFRLIDFYGVELKKLGFFYEPGNRQHSDAESGRKVIEGIRQLIEARCEVRDPADGPFSIQYAFQTYSPRSEVYLAVVRFGEQMRTITRWLYKERRGIDVRLRGGLLVARLSDDEIWLWNLAIAMTMDQELIAFCQCLGLIGEGGSSPKYIGTGRVFTAETLKADMEAFFAQTDLYFERQRTKSTP